MKEDTKRTPQLEFIQFFTRNKSLTKQQIRLRDKLLARDCAKVVSSLTDDRGYQDPKKLQEFLLAYNQDPFLKYTCHPIDSDETIKEICEACGTSSYDFEKHADLLVQKFKELKRQKSPDLSTSKNLIAMMTVYLTGEIGKSKTWSSNNVKENWHYANIIKWAEQHKGIVPNPGGNIARKQRNTGYKLESSFISKITGERILNFVEVVIFFKSLFHIRRDNSLKKIIEHINATDKDISKEDSNFEISFSEENFYENVELFTDVDKLCQAYKAILSICRNNQPKASQPTQIELAFYSNGKHTYFEIHHLNTVYGKSLKDATRIGEKQADLIKHQINGLCDLIIEADFDHNDYARVTLWTKMRPEVERIDPVVGVKYILRF